MDNNSLLVIGIIVLFLFIMFNRRNTENFEKINDTVYKISRDDFFRDLRNANSYAIAGIGSDGDTVKIVGTAPAIMKGQRERIPLLLYAGPSGDILMKKIELGKEYKCLPETFGGIDPAFGLNKTCFVSPM